MYSLYFITFQTSGTRPVTKPLRSIRPEQRGTFHTQFWLIAIYIYILLLLLWLLLLLLLIIIYYYYHYYYYYLYYFYILIMYIYIYNVYIYIYVLYINFIIYIYILYYIYYIILYILCIYLVGYIVKSPSMSHRFSSPQILAKMPGLTQQAELGSWDHFSARYQWHSIYKEGWFSSSHLEMLVNAV